MINSINVNRKRLFQLDGLRFVMTIIVFVSHFLDSLLISQNSINIFNTYFNGGSLAVDFFFILSGFGIYYSSKNEVYDTKFSKLLLYAIDRIKKIYPIYIFSLILGMLYQFPIWIGDDRYNLSIVAKIAKNIISLLLDISLLQSLTGIANFSRAINGVCWFLSSLFISYIFCPIFINIVKKANSKKDSFFGIFITLIIIFVLSLFARNFDGNLFYGIINDLFYGHPFIRCFYLLLGMFLSNLFLLNNKKVESSSFVEIVVIILYFFHYLFRETFIKFTNNFFCNYEMVRIFDIAFTSMLIYFFAFGKGIISRFLSDKKIQFLGKKSIYIFLFHYPIVKIIKLLLTYFDVLYLVESKGFLFCVFLLTISLIYISYKFYMINENMYISFSDRYHSILCKYIK